MTREGEREGQREGRKGKRGSGREGGEGLVAREQIGNLKRRLLQCNY
jgi:hypothetical protein